LDHGVLGFGRAGHVFLCNGLSRNLTDHGVERGLVPAKIKEAVIGCPAVLQRGRHLYAQIVDERRAAGQAFGHQEGQDARDSVIAQRDQLGKQVADAWKRPIWNPVAQNVAVNLQSQQLGDFIALSFKGSLRFVLRQTGLGLCFECCLRIRLAARWTWRDARVSRVISLLKLLELVQPQIKDFIIHVIRRSLPYLAGFKVKAVSSFQRFQFCQIEGFFQADHVGFVY